MKTSTYSFSGQNKRLSHQKGSINSLLLILIVGGLAYSAFFAKTEDSLSFDSAQASVENFFTELSSVTSGERTAFNSDFSGYGVQLMATKQLGQAKGVMNDFAKDGYSAFVLASKAKGRTVYKVRLGPFSHKPEAVAVQSNVARRYPNNPYVKTSLVIYKPN